MTVHGTPGQLIPPLQKLITEQEKEKEKEDEEDEKSTYGGSTPKT